MKGSYRIVVSNTRLRYDFVIRRNLTIIRGDSATGKTTLVEMIREYYESGEESGVTLQCERECRVIGGRDWRTLLSAISGAIVFIDENNDFLPTDAFAEAVRGSDNYYVIISREGLPNLPYSVEEIYGIRESGKYGSLKQVYNELYHIYGHEAWNTPVRPSALITEDSNAGFEFFREAAAGLPVTSAGGKSNIPGRILQAEPGTVVIADGAAFGPEIDRALKLARQSGNVVLYLPESFEWLILKSGVPEFPGREQILMHPEDEIDSRLYLSWERYFTALLTEATRGSWLQYSKNRLNRVYLQKEIAGRIMEAMENIEFPQRGQK